MKYNKQELLVDIEEYHKHSASNNLSKMHEIERKYNLYGYTSDTVMTEFLFIAQSHDLDLELIR